MIIKKKKTKENDKQHYLKWQNVQYRQKAYQKKNAISGKQNPGIPVTAGRGWLISGTGGRFRLDCRKIACLERDFWKNQQEKDEQQGGYSGIGQHDPDKIP